VRYHVSVLDIRRTNGLLADSALFARDFVHIPTRQLPIGCGGLGIAAARFLVSIR
jgi:hypothetical protein